jgi:RNA polymerase sigma factor (sigma-70 family)
MTDEELAERYRNGDVAAFTDLYGRHKHAFYTYLRNRAPGDADDVFQEAFMKFADAILKREIANPKGYLYMIGLNLVRNLGRRPPMAPLEDDSELPDDHEPVQVLVDEADQTVVRDAMSKLAADRPAFYDVLHLHVFEELSFDDISGLLERNRNTVSAQYRYALQYLRRHMEENHD